MTSTYSCRGNPWPAEIEEPAEEAVVDEEASLWNSVYPYAEKASGFYDDYYLSYLRKPYETLEDYFPEAIVAADRAWDAAGDFLAGQAELMGEFYGTPLGEFYDDQKDIVSAYYKRVTPNAYGTVVTVLDAPKIGYDMYVTWALNNVVGDKKTVAAVKSLDMPESSQNVIFFAANTLAQGSDPCITAYAESRFGKLVPHADDDGMKSTYHVVALNSPIVNSFTTGSTIYVTRGALEELATDAETDALLAHELSHGDQGHAIGNLGNLLWLSVKHLGALLLDEMAWEFTGRISPLLRTVMNEGNLAAILNDMAVTAPQVEIEADVGAVEILQRAGNSPEDMKTMLIRLHGLDPENVGLTQDELATLGAGSKDKIREYPGLQERLEAVDNAAK